jgi:hypothetical protein
MRPERTQPLRKCCSRSNLQRPLSLRQKRGREPVRHHPPARAEKTARDCAILALYQGMTSVMPKTLDLLRLSSRAERSRGPTVAARSWGKRSEGSGVVFRFHPSNRDHRAPHLRARFLSSSDPAFSRDIQLHGSRQPSARLTTSSESRYRPIREVEYRWDPGPVGTGCRPYPAKWLRWRSRSD